MLRPALSCYMPPHLPLHGYYCYAGLSLRIHYLVTAASSLLIITLAMPFIWRHGWLPAINTMHAIVTLLTPLLRTVGLYVTATSPTPVTATAAFTPTRFITIYILLYMLAITGYAILAALPCHILLLQHGGYLPRATPHAIRHCRH